MYVSIHSVLGIIFYDFVANSVRKFCSTDQLTPRSQIFSLSCYLLVQLLHLPLKFHLSKLFGNNIMHNNRKLTIKSVLIIVIFFFQSFFVHFNRVHLGQEPLPWSEQLMDRFILDRF